MDFPSKTEENSPQKTEKEDSNRERERMITSPNIIQNEEKNKTQQTKPECVNLPLKVLNE